MFAGGPSFRGRRSIRGVSPVNHQAHPPIMRERGAVCRGLSFAVVLTRRGTNLLFLLVLLPKVITRVRSDSHIR